ncbi:hypothetical protein C8R47DRAFT_1211921 [Mycena vitilis]|nr:hypothetical protein C8R47DRAFT_1231181 [Mycena vitilis]KAJ6499628.1 hypothetical protein C8R47DRAFT_1211921 [Mycena vitilis]
MPQGTVSLSMPARLAIDPAFQAALGRVNRYRIYVIYGDTPGGIESNWDRHHFSCAAEAWMNCTEMCSDLITRSWLYGHREAMRRERHP